MRPSLNMLDEELTARIVDEAMRVLAEVGMEVRGLEMRRRLRETLAELDADPDVAKVPCRFTGSPYRLTPSRIAPPRLPFGATLLPAAGPGHLPGGLPGDFAPHGARWTPVGMPDPPRGSYRN